MSDTPVNGTVAPGYEDVLDVFTRSFEHGEVGAAVRSGLRSSACSFRARSWSTISWMPTSASLISKLLVCHLH